MSSVRNFARENDGNLPGASMPLSVVDQFHDVLKEVSDTVSPVWPLKDYVAVNPYFGIHQRRFIDARAFLKVFSDCEMLMPVTYYAEQFERAEYDVDDVETAIDELSEMGLGTSLQPSEILSRLKATHATSSLLDQPPPDGNPERCLRTIAELATQSSGIQWKEVICDEVSNYCARHYDEGQASWNSPYRHLPLFESWRKLAADDYGMEALGLKGFRRYVQEMPLSAEGAIIYCLNRLKIPLPLWSTFLLCQAFSIPGWSAWAKYQDAQSGPAHGGDFGGLLAMRLAYDVALSETLGIQVEWGNYVREGAACFPMPSTGNETVLRHILLRASEIGFRKRLLQSLGTVANAKLQVERKFAQLVFCIDVRSERIRRQIESVSRDIETFGFAGFFAMPMAYTSFAESASVSQLPVLLQPQFVVREGLGRSDHANSEHADGSTCHKLAGEVATRSWRKLWRGFQTSAVSCFSFVETNGVFFGFKLLRRVLGWQRSASPSVAVGNASGEEILGPTLQGLSEQGVGFDRQVTLAASLLRNLGLLKNFSRFVVFCGHESQTDNNPLAAGLDCGACGGHSGKPNARFAALLLNQPEIRKALGEQGIEIPSDTHFLAAVHNTTTDAIEFSDLHLLPSSHRTDLEQLQNSLAIASTQTRQERLPTVNGSKQADLLRRAVDWSEVRPEWGLAGNAAFVVAPRAMTKDCNLNARSFLHSYEHSLDADGSVLELIMTAPMVVANWINMQYYASTVDNHHFGSGNKTVHNVVGQFGVLSGNGGDLQTGLPWQSLHSGDHYQHLPLRLQVVIAAPREAIDRVIQKHELVSDLITNSWLHLLAIEDDGQRYRYSVEGNWKPC